MTECPVYPVWLPFVIELSEPKDRSETHEVFFMFELHVVKLNKNDAYAWWEILM